LILLSPTIDGILCEPESVPGMWGACLVAGEHSLFLDYPAQSISNSIMEASGEEILGSRLSDGRRA